MNIKYTILGVSFTVILGLTALPQQAWMAPTTPVVAPSPGAWATGQTPANVSPNKPAILFVHGLTSKANVWYEDNDMYEYAYKNGYQTAFINMYDITGTPEDMWKDGELLATKIQEISKYFGKKVVIVAHSKGGVDTQSALVRYNAYPYVSRVITLSTPHHGSQLADLAYSSWAGWLADLVGSQSPGTSSLQTSYMDYFRSEMAKDPDVNKVPFYTMSGNKWSGSGKASYTFGGSYLSLFGSNDGVVTTDSALLPSATLIQSGAWNHKTVRTGSSTFDLFKSYIGTLPAAVASLKTPASVTENTYQTQPSATNPTMPSRSQSTPPVDPYNVTSEDGHGQYYIRGGEHQGVAHETLTVENNVKTISLDWLSDQPLTDLQFISPSGKKQNINVQSNPDDEFFPGAYHQIATLQQPEAGEWKVQATSASKGAYLMTAVYTPGAEQVELKTNLSNNQLRMNVNTEGLDEQRTHLNYTVNYYHPDGTKLAPPTERANRSMTTQESVTTPVANTPSIYVVTTDIDGYTEAGYPYRRTLVKSVYVDEQGNTYSQ
ncbi:alpha/beta hydrolase [Paenibacillus sp. PK4536]|uniref:esterase/lipase family protein n=1 Tax=Paenibacillus sp. PK4536 TaxID=3024576 RepID=UPI002358EC8D|nr:alpha/beta hydrolase [Paenibacillus sp. PK4536]WIM37930.1 alpha/beta hydrolase [Paenibacillus sp. PK4536]